MDLIFLVPELCEWIMNNILLLYRSIYLSSSTYVGVDKNIWKIMSSFLKKPILKVTFLFLIISFL